MYDSAKEDQGERKKAAAREHFKSAGEWLDSPVTPAGPLVCPCTFENGSHSRCKANVESQPFLVVESDELSHEDFVAVINFLKQRLKLRAVEVYRVCGLKCYAVIPAGAPPPPAPAPTAARSHAPPINL